MEDYKREYNVLKIREYIKGYYSKSEWNILDIIERLFTHEFYLYGQRILTLLKCEMNLTIPTFSVMLVKIGDTYEIRHK